MAVGVVGMVVLAVASGPLILSPGVPLGRVRGLAQGLALSPGGQ